MNKAILVLKGGVVFEGISFGVQGETIGEVVFNTSITGYQEILTDPSYNGQIVTMTYTQIGNYGVNQEDIESFGGPKVEGFVVKEYIDSPSNWRSDSSLGEYLKTYNIVGIQGIDTRAITRYLRNYGAQMGAISTIDLNFESLLRKIKDCQDISQVDLVKEMTTKNIYNWTEGCWKWKYIEDKDKEISKKPSLIVYDLGVKFNILRNLADIGFDVTVVPAHTLAEAVLEMNPDGIVLSNGPGNPEMVDYIIKNVKKLISKKPIFGICLGHQILGLAMGGKTYKLKFGHHGGNHPVKDLITDKIEITSQNHNYCVDVKTLGDKIRLTHRNLYDGTEEGMEHSELPIMSVQYHPEAGPGPNDSSHIFKRFKEKIQSCK